MIRHRMKANGVEVLRFLIGMLVLSADYVSESLWQFGEPYAPAEQSISQLEAVHF